ncbi:hypothetical protein B0H19DRAFT_1139107, partial [Mycena capillaripes]
MNMAVQLKRIGFSNFRVRCSSEVFIHLYSLSTDLNPDWVHSHAFQPAIQEYLLQIALTIFVVSAQWD